MPWRVPSESLTGFSLSQLENRLYAQDSKLAPWLKLQSLAAAKIVRLLLLQDAAAIPSPQVTNSMRDSPL
jgi:hypothetical protein